LEVSEAVRQLMLCLEPRLTILKAAGRQEASLELHLLIGLTYDQLETHLESLLRMVLAAGELV
jgi:hypothetical protein